MLKIFKFLILVSLVFFNTIYAKELQKVSLQLQWLHQFQFAGYYIAKERGFYEDVGLDVTIKEYKNGLDIVSEVTDNEATYGTGRPTLIIDKSDGADIVLLASIFQSSPHILLTTELSGIKTIKDFKNKRVMSTGDAKTDIALVSMMFSQDTILKDIIMLEPSFNVIDLINRKTDLMASYISNEPFQLKELGVEPVIFNPRDYGFDFYSDILFTSEDERNMHKQRVHNFTKASIKGWEYAFENIEESVLLILNKYNTQNKSKKALIYEANELKKLAYYNTNELGHIDIKKIEKIYDIYNLMGFIKKKFDIDEYVFHDDMHRLTNLNNEEKKYLRDNTIRVCVHPDIYPYEFIKDGKYGGITAEYIKLLQTKHPLNLEIVEAKDDGELFNNVYSDKCDIKPLVLSKHNMVSKNMNESDIIAYDNLVLITKQNKPYINNLAILNNKKIAVSSKALKDFLNTHYPFFDITIMPDKSKAMEQVIDDKIFGYLELSLHANHLIQKYGYNNLKVNVKLSVTPVRGVIGISKKEPQLLVIINKLISQIPNRNIEDIKLRWSMQSPYKVIDYTLVWQLISIFIIILLIVLFFLIRQKILKEKIELLNLTLEDKVDKQVKEIKKSTLLFETIFETVKDGIAILDLDSNFLLINKAYENITGCTKEELYNTSYIKLVAPHMLDSAKEALQTVINKGYFGGCEKQLCLKENKIIDVNIELILMPDKKSILIIMKDVTLQNQYKREKELQNQQIFHQSRLAQMGEMISMIAHQWRQPLNAISLTSSNLQFKLMMDNIDSDYFKKEIILIDKYSQHLSKTIDDFRGFFKEDKDTETTTLKDIINSTLDIVKTSIENKNIKIITYFSCTAELITYPNEIKQVLLNLIKNAEDALLESRVDNPHIIIEVRCEDEKKIVIIKDNAGGVPEDIIDKIFDPYFSTKISKDGTGLGLYMSKTIIEEHCRGKLSVKNSDAGACFKITLENGKEDNEKNTI